MAAVLPDNRKSHFQALSAPFIVLIFAHVTVTLWLATAAPELLVPTEKPISGSALNRASIGHRAIFVDSNNNRA